MEDDRKGQKRNKLTWWLKKYEEKEKKICSKEEIYTPFESNIKTVAEEHISSETRLLAIHPDFVTYDEVQHQPLLNKRSLESTWFVNKHN